MRVASYREMNLLGKLSLAFLILSASTGFALVRSDISNAALVSDSTIRDFCSTVTPIGYYDLMYINDGSSNQTITLTSPSQTTYNLTFKVETWFCGPRTYDLDTKDYTIKGVGSSDDMIIWKSRSSYRVVAGDIDYTNGDGHHLMNSPNISATIDVSGFADGSTHRLCPRHTVRSFAPGAFDQPVDPMCTNFRVVYDFPWSTTATTNMELKRVGDASFSSASDGTIVYPGDVLRWSSDVTIDNIFAGGPTIDTSQRRYGASSAATDGTLSFTTTPLTRTAAANAQYIVVSGDAGDDICEFLRWSPVSSTDNGSDDSDDICAKVGYLPNLSPQKPTGLPDVALPDTNLTGIGASVSNTGSTKSQPNTKAAVVRFVVPSPQAPPTAGGVTTLLNNVNYRCQIAQKLSPSQTDCASIGPEYSGTFELGSTAIVNAIADDLASIVSLDFGDHVCYASMVNMYENGKGIYDWRYSDPHCVAIKKTPTVHVWGNDVRVGSALESADNADSKIQSLTIPGDSGNYFGSWSEYGAIAPADILGFASGAGLYGGNTNDPIDWSNLTFANATSPYGSFVADPPILDKLGTLPRIKDWDFSGAKIVTPSNSKYKGWETPFASSKIVVVKGDSLRIDGNIEIPSALSNYGSVAEMPQMIIIANNILIDNDVETIDAWLIASDTINTCAKGGSANSNVDDKPNVNQCNEQLTINGPVIAKNLKLYRTFGADSIATLDEPAETINFSADSYVWARHQAEQSGGLRTVAIRELPPRF